MKPGFDTHNCDSPRPNGIMNRAPLQSQRAPALFHGAGAKRRILRPLQSQVLGPKPKYVLGGSQTLDPTAMWWVAGVYVTPLSRNYTGSASDGLCNFENHDMDTPTGTSLSKLPHHVFYTNGKRPLSTAVPY
ncbi:hypothetical protein TNCV_3661451 [Trichonephila clavipes]|nr:hypothetical protein TNCV_3661451 [Trichonephila clavipes]